MRIVIGVLVLLILGAAGFAFYVSNQSLIEPPTITGPVPTLEPTASSELIAGSESAAPLSGYGSYLVGWGEEAIRNSEAEKVVLFFYADWCPTCRPVDIEFKNRMTEFPKNLQVFRINYNDSETTDEFRALAQKYGVNYQHTFVQIDKQGNEITKWNGGGLDNLLSKIK